MPSTLAVSAPLMQYRAAMQSQDAPGMVRLQKFISECGIASRRGAEKLILAKKVSVNGLIVSELGSKIDPLRDRVTVRNKIIKPPTKGILLFNKPRNVISTLEDPEGRPTVAEYLTKHHTSYFPVGRLDFESTGLVVLTNDGELAQHLLHPSFEMDRVYHVRVSGSVSLKTAEKLSRGVRLDDGVARAKVEIMSHGDDATWLEITVREGRNRLIRRMMEKVLHPVMKLKRVSHGPFRLGNLQPGEIKKLSEREYKYFRQKVLNYEPQAREEKKQEAPKKVRYKR